MHEQCEPESHSHRQVCGEAATSSSLRRRGPSLAPGPRSWNHPSVIPPARIHWRRQRNVRRESRGGADLALGVECGELLAK